MSATIETTARFPLHRGQAPTKRPPLPPAFLRYLEEQRAAGRPVALNRKTTAALRSMGRTDLLVGVSRQSMQLRDHEIDAELQNVRIALLQSRGRGGSLAPSRPRTTGR